MINGIKNINTFIALANFIEESIESKINQFSQILLTQNIKENSFDIRKVLRTLKDRAKHLKIVSESFSAQSGALISRLDLYDGEIAFEIAQKLQKIGWTFSIIFVVLAFAQLL